MKCHMARSAPGTTSCTITRGTGTVHFTICGWICVRICGMRITISSTWSGVFTAVSCHGLTTHGSASMRDFDVSYRVLFGSLSVAVVCCGAWLVSYPQPPWRTRHGCTVGIDREPPVRRPHPRRMMGTSDRRLCVRACGLRVGLARGHGFGWQFSGVVLTNIRRLSQNWRT